MSQEMSSDIGFGAANTGGESSEGGKNLKNSRRNSLGVAKAATSKFLTDVRATAGTLQHDNDTLKNQNTLLNAELTKCGIELHECQSRNCEEYDPMSEENLADPKPQY